MVSLNTKKPLRKLLKIRISTVIQNLLKIDNRPQPDFHAWDAFFTCMSKVYLGTLRTHAEHSECPGVSVRTYNSCTARARGAYVRVSCAGGPHSGLKVVPVL